MDFKEFTEGLVKSEKGYFLLENHSGRAYLCIFPGSHPKNNVQWQEVRDRLNLFNIQYEENYVKDLVRKADGKWYEIGSWEEPESVDAEFEILINEDFTEAYIEITPPIYKGKWFTYEELKNKIRQKNIQIGVDEIFLKQLAERKLPELKEQGDWKKKFLIAKAIPPEPSTNGRIQFYFDPNPHIRPKETENGRVDFRNLNVIQTCREEELLAEIIPPKMGKEGVDILGNPIPFTQPKNAVLEAGENTILQDGKLFSKITGQVKIQTNEDHTYAKISVVEVLELENVDFSTGNIDFTGTVKVKNRVMDGFEIKAKGDIIIEKTVSNVKLYALSDIILNGGIVSYEGGTVYAEGNIYAKFIQNSQVTAKKNIYVEELIIHSEVMAGEEIHLEQGRGELIGGKTVCGKKIIAKKIGTIAEPYTLIYLGISPELLTQLTSLNWEIEKNKKMLLEIEKNKNYLESHPEKLEKQWDFYEKLKLVYTKLQQKTENFLQQKEMLLYSEKGNKEAMLQIQEVLYPNVELIFGAKSRKYKQLKSPLMRKGYFKYDPLERVVRFYRT
ncbi:MAG: DUF342 domain-containing protein [Leptonema sp. (in: bacteria)]